MLGLENCINRNVTSQIGNSGNINKIENCYDVKESRLIKHIIYGDYKLKNQKVEVFLNQRTSKKIKYDKKEYEEIHPISKEVIDWAKIELKSHINSNNSVDLSINTSINSIDKEYQHLKNKFSNRYNLSYSNYI